MSFDRNEIETRFIAEIDDPSFDEIDRRLKETAENASEAQRAVIAVPLPFDPVAPAGGAGVGVADVRKLTKTTQAATQGIRTLSRSASALGVEMGAGADAILSTTSMLPGLIAALQSLQSIALGPVGIAAAAAAVVLGGIMVVAMDDVSKGSKEMAKQLQKQVDFERSLLDAKQKTSDQIKEELADINARIEGEREYLDVTKERSNAMDEAIKKTGVLGAAILWAGSTFGDLGDPLDVVNQAYKDQTKVVSDLEADHAALTAALKTEAVAANDATQALLQESDTLADIRKFEQEALASSAEENDKRAQAIADESAIIRERIALLEDSKNQTKEVADEIADLNSELAQLGQQSNILNSSAVAAAEAQRALAAAEIELEASAKAAASAAKAAASRTAAASAAESKAIAADSRADKKATAERTKLGQEQAQEFGELQLDQHEARIKAEKDFNKSIEDLVENQSFLAAIDKQDDFVDTEQDRRNASKKELISLQMSLAEERIVREIAAQEANADRNVAIAEASANLRNAQREEIRLRRAADREALKLQRNRAEQESDLQAQVNKNAIAMIQSVVTFSANAASQVRRNLSQSATGGKKGRKGKSITSSLAEMMNEVMR